MCATQRFKNVRQFIFRKGTPDVPSLRQTRKQQDCVTTKSSDLSAGRRERIEQLFIPFSSQSIRLLVRRSRSQTKHAASHHLRTEEKPSDAGNNHTDHLINHLIKSSKFVKLIEHAEYCLARVKLIVSGKKIPFFDTTFFRRMHTWKKLW